MGFSLGEAILGTGIDLAGLRKGLEQADSESRAKIGGIAGVFQAGFGLAATAATVAIGAVVAGAAAAGVAIWNVGQTMDGAFDSIAIATGATGANLEGLKGSFTEVFSSVPTDADTAAGVIGELNKRLGYTGDTLEEVATPMLEMSRLLGGDASTNAALFSRVVGDWSISNEDAAGTLDKLFRAGQLTGVGVDNLMQKVVQFGSPLRLMGFTLDDSIALFGKWEKEGVNAELVMGSLRIAAGKFAADGKPLRESLLATFDSIKNNTDASAALAQAMDVFGARAGPDMAAAIREGRFSIDELLTAMGSADGAIIGTAASTADFGEKLMVLQNQAMVAVAPLGGLMLDLANSVMTAATPAIEGLVASAGNLSTYIVANWPMIQATALSVWTQVQPILQGMGDFVTGTLLPILVSAVAWVVTNWPMIQQKALEMWATIQPIFQAYIDFLTANVLPIWNMVVAWVVTNWPLISATVQGVMAFIQARIGEALAAIAAWWSEHGASVMSIVESYYAGIKSIVETVLGVVRGIIAAVLPAIKAFWDTWGTDIQRIVSGLFAVVGDLFDAFAKAFEGDWRGFGEELGQAWEKIWAGIQEIVTRAAEWFGKQDWGAIGQGIIDGIGAGISAAAGALGDAAMAAARAALDAAKGFLGIHSPSTLAATEVGMPIGEGVGVGILQSMPAIRGAMATATGAAIDQSRNVSHTWNLTAQYAYQSERSLRDDVSMLQMLGAAT